MNAKSVMATDSDSCGGRKCEICAEALSSPWERTANSSQEKIPDVFGNSTKTNNLAQVFLQCLGDNVNFSEDFDYSNFDSDPDEGQVILCTRCQNYLTQWNDLNNQIDLLQLQANQVKFTLYAMILKSLKKFMNPPGNDTSLKPNSEKTAENSFISHENAQQHSFKNLVQNIRNRICNRFNVQVLVRKCPDLEVQSCKPAAAVASPQFTCVTVATDKYVYADKYAFFFQDEKFRCAECSAAVSKKCDMLRHIRVKHLRAHESEEKKSRVKNREVKFTNKMDLNITKTEGNTGRLESEECDLDEPKLDQTDCPRLCSRRSLPDTVIDIDSNDYQHDADGDWNANSSLSEGSDSEVEATTHNDRKSSPGPSIDSLKISKPFRPNRGYYAPAEDGSMVDPYGHVLKQTAPNEFLYANEHKFHFQNGRYYCDHCEYNILKRCRMLLHIRLKHMSPQQNEVKPRVIQLRPIGPAQDPGKFQAIVTPEGKWKCGECDLERNRKIDIWHHIRQLHMDKRSQKSGNIKTFSFKEVRPNEYLYHDKFPFRFNTEDEMYVCGICDHKSSRRQSMIPHMRGSHFTEEETRLYSSVEVSPGEFLYAGKYKIFFADGRYSCGICGCVKEVIWELYPHMKKFHFLGSHPAETSVAMETKEVTNVGQQEAAASVATANLTGKIPEAFNASVGAVTSKGQQYVPVAKIRKMTANLPLPDPITGRIDLQYMGIPYSYESTIRKWTCSLCPIVRACRNRMSTHIRRKHINPERFVCDVCGLEANDRNVFRRHQARHEGARFKCHLCDKQFADRTYLLTHLRIHKGEEGKKFQCEFCGKKFHSKKQYSNHVPTHTGEKPFPCDMCGERFSNTFQRRQHSKKVHDGVPQPMKVPYVNRKSQPVSSNSVEQLSLPTEPMV